LRRFYEIYKAPLWFFAKTAFLSAQTPAAGKEWEIGNFLAIPDKIWRDLRKAPYDKERQSLGIDFTPYMRRCDIP
jgi:hypothetical protein